MAERRSMALQSSDDAEAYRRLNRRIWKSLRHDVRAHNTVSIKETIERNGGSKVFARDLSIGQSQLSRLKTDGGRMVSTRAEVLREIERFYGQLYTSVAKPTASSAEDPRAELIRYFSDDIPDISLCEIEMALKQLKNNKAPGEDGITSELLKAGGTPILKSPSDALQFRSPRGFNARGMEQERGAFVDYEKAFDSIETWAVLQSLQQCHIDYRYIEVLRCIYNNATMSVRVQDQSTKAIPLQRGVRQGDVISPKLFTAALENAFKLFQWKGFGININGEYITHLRFADDIVVLAESLEDLSTMLEDLNQVSQQLLDTLKKAPIINSD
ncbi:uncharacterized protein LOC119189192 [Manduca sexta]|uniref:uncharacterized protein LOC119189192 n=1 Tax=Manduca sexta TaxID=7130 RepID=UPI00188F88C6|nr:uncharacterized protein LOC119189192 [Manduca sexta]